VDFCHRKGIYQNTGILAANSWDNLFSEEFVEKLGAIIVKLHRKRAEYKSQMDNYLSHRLFLAS
jgi:hypothetical protein